MSDFVDKDPAINTPQRPGSTETIGWQPDIFPFDAFEFDDANKVDEPILTMKAPWKLVAGSITAEAIQAAFISATEIVVGYLGTNLDIPVIGDRRLIIKAFVMSLQHYDINDSEADTDGWVDDISLGGFDSGGDFVDYIMSSGISQNREDAKFVDSGMGFPAPRDINQEFYFSNWLAKTRMGEQRPSDINTTLAGEYAGEEYFKGASASWNMSNAADAGTISWWGTGTSSAETSYARRGVPVNFFGTFNIDLTEYDLRSYDASVCSFTMNNIFQQSTADRASTNLTVRLYIRRVTHELYADVYLRSSTDADFQLSRVTSDLEHNLGIYAEDGINKIAYKFFAYYAPYAYATGFVNWRRVTSGANNFSCVIKTDSGVSTSSVSISDNATASMNATTDINTLEETTYSSSHGVDNRTLNGIDSITCGSIFFNEGYGIACDWVGGCNYVPLSTDGLLIDSFYTTGIFFSRDDYFSAVDSYRDIALIPSSNFGKIVMVSGGSIPEEYADTYITVTGPIGPDGATGPTGDTGPEGSSFFDGGTWDTIYVPDQIIDGGSW